tara:strand:- start:48 stop:506 length:459 start_codon:yes stop_codon:yes gene_type:complete
MFVLGLFVIIFLITQGFILLEEETLILLAGIFWVDLAGSFIRTFLISELEHKGDKIAEEYIKFFSFKEESLSLLYILHRKRFIGSELISTYLKTRELILFSTVVYSLENLLYFENIANKFILKDSICFLGTLVIGDYQLNKLDTFLSKYYNE